MCVCVCVCEIGGGVFPGTYTLKLDLQYYQCQANPQKNVFKRVLPEMSSSVSLQVWHGAEWSNLLPEKKAFLGSIAIETNPGPLGETYVNTGARTSHTSDNGVIQWPTVF